MTDQPANTASVRRAVQVAGVAAAIAAWAPVVIFYNRLPDPIATHWGLTGGPNGSMPRLQGVLLAPLVATAAGSVAVFYRRLHAAAFFACIAGFLAAISWLAITANVNAPNWHHAASTHLPLHLGVAAAFAVITVVVLHALPPEHRPAPTGPGPSAGIRKGQRASWSATTGWSPGIAAGVFVVGVIGIIVAGPALIGVVAVAVAISFFCHIRVSADTRGLIVHYGWLPYPRSHIPLSRIRAARIEDINPMEWGGWGYRLGPGRTAVVLHRGEGLVLDLDNGRRFAITVHDAETAAGVLNDLRDLSAIQ